VRGEARGIVNDEKFICTMRWLLAREGRLEHTKERRKERGKKRGDTTAIQQNQFSGSPHSLASRARKKRKRGNNKRQLRKFTETAQRLVQEGRELDQGPEP